MDFTLRIPAGTLPGDLDVYLRSAQQGFFNTAGNANTMVVVRTGTITILEPNQQNVTVSFDLHGGEANLAFDDQNFPAGELAAEPEIDPTREGYHFAGWYTEAEGGIPFDFDSPIYNDTVVHARWLEYLTVSFDLHGGRYEAAFPDQNVPAGRLATHPVNDPVRGVVDCERGNAFVFDGWFTHPYTGYDDETEFDFSAPITESITLYARWTPVSPRMNHIDPGTSLIRGTGIPYAYVRVYLPCGTIVDSWEPADSDGNWFAIVFAQGRPVLQAGETVYTSQSVDSRRGEQSHRPVGDQVLNEVQLFGFYTWRNNEVGRPHHVVKGDGITMAIVVENTGIPDARDVRVTICAFDWLPYNEIEILGGENITMYHCLVENILIFEVGYLLSGEEVVFFLSAQALESVRWDAIPGRRMTVSASIVQ